MVVPTPDGVLNPLVCWRPRSPASTRSSASAAPRPWPRWPTARNRSRPVDKITGPGNAYVAAAKRRVFGQVGIDLIAGPSEILVVADGRNDPAWIAADLLSQAEHDAVRAVDPDHRRCSLRRPRGGAVETELLAAWRAPTSRGASWRDNGCIILVPRPRGRGADRRPHRRRASRARAWSRTRRGAGRPHPPCRRDLPRPPHARGDRRLCRRHQPRAADRRARRASRAGSASRFPEAHLAGRLHARGAGRARAGGAGAGRSRGPGRARPLGVDPAEPPRLRRR